MALITLIGQLSRLGSVNVRKYGYGYTVRTVR